MARKPKSAKAGIRFLAMLLFLTAAARATDHPHAIGGFVNFVTDSRLYPTPFSANPILHNDSYSLGGTIGFSGDYRYALNDNLLAGFLLEYLPNKSQSTDQNNTLFEDGFSMFIAELSAYFILPIGSDRFHILVGGGLGAYMGRRQYAIGGVASRSIATPPSVGIHVTSGFEYRLSELLSLRAELHFRNPDIVTENAFDARVIHANGYDYPVETAPFKSKVDVNGNVYRVGVALHF